MSQLRGGVLTPIKQRARNALHRGVDHNQRLVLPNHQFDQFPLDPNTTLAFRFDRDKSLTDLVAGLTLDFTRASNATFYDSNGILRTAANDVARFDHVPFTKQSLGLFREDARTNLAVRSNLFSDAAWSKNRVTVAQDETGPDGVANSAWTFTDDAVLGSHAVSQAGLFATQADRRVSVYVKRGTGRWATIATRNYGSTPSSRVSIFDMLTGTFSHFGAAYQDFKVEQLPNGFWRLSKTAFDLNATYNDIWCGISSGPDPLDTSYVGTGETMIFYGAQGEQADFESSYVESGAATATRAADAPFTNDVTWYNPVENSIFIKASFPTVSTGQLFSIDDTSSSDYIAMLALLAGTTQQFIRSGGVTQTSGGIVNAWANNVPSKLSMGLIANDGQSYADAVAGLSLNPLAMPIGVNRLLLGDGFAQPGMFGHIQQFGAADIRHSNIFLEQITL